MTELERLSFIKTIAQFVKKYAPKYDICVRSPIIAQAVLESDFGTSELAKNANNYFGLKYKASVANDFYIKIGSEQNEDGSYTSSVMKWCKFHSMEEGVKGYFEFIYASRYVNLKGVSEPKTYLENIKADGYATSLNYVSNLMNVIEKYDLTKYDDIKNKGDIKAMKINVHAGHNPDGKIACGAVGLIKESTQARLVKDQVIQMLRSLGHTVYDCTVDNGKTQKDVLRKICAKCNANTVDLDVSIHFNSGANDRNGNGTTTGTEVLIYSDKTKAYAQNICNAISALGFKNRGVKYRTDLYFLKQTKAPALLIECCFVDDADDVKRYNASEMASAIVKGITGQSVGQNPENEPSVKYESKLYKVQCGAYSKKENAEELQKRLKASGFDAFIVEV